MGIKKAKGNVGRPAKFTSADELQKAINIYFEQEQETPTLSGLALALGFESRQSMYDYEKKGDAFSYTIKRARLQVECIYEKRLYSNSPAGAIFALKNLGWSDRVQQEISGLEGKPVQAENSHTVIFRDYSETTDNRARTTG